MKVEQNKSASDEAKLGQIKLLYDGQTTSPRQLSYYYGDSMDDVLALFQTSPCTMAVQAIERLKEKHKKRSLPCISKKEWFEEDQRFRGEEDTEEVRQDPYVVAYIKLMQAFEKQLGGNYFSMNPKDNSVLSRFERLFVTHRFLIACRGWLRNTNQISNMYQGPNKQETKSTDKTGQKRGNEGEESPPKRRRRQRGTARTIQITRKRGPGRPPFKELEQKGDEQISEVSDENQNVSCSLI